MARFLDKHSYSWQFTQAGAEHGFTFTCGYCANRGAPLYTIRGQLFVAGHGSKAYGHIHFCPVCFQPSYFDFGGEQVPAVRLGATLNKVPDDGLKQLYDEARDSSAAGAYTGCVMLCRKILMNLAVREGAKPNQSFKDYVDYLAANNFIPPKGKVWVDKIRDKGNEANHEIQAQSVQDAKDILHLVEMLLRFNYEITP
jgi:hypothetical protein